MAKGKHALLSPSSAHRWLLCPGSVGLSKDIPDITNEHALAGSAAHRLAEICFQEKNDAKKHVGKMYAVDEIDAYLIEEDMASFVQVYLDYVRGESKGKILLVEQSLPLTPLTGEADAFGTADAVVIESDTLHLIDLKFGMGHKVYAEENEQLMLYTAAARLHYDSLGEFTKFKISIVQPRLDHIDVWEFSKYKLDELIFRVKTVAPSALDGTGRYNPSEKTCMFCKAKAICPALAKQVSELTSAGFDDLGKNSEVDLSKSMLSVGMVEDWCRAVRAEVERRLITGDKVTGFKLVAGRMGPRKWRDEKEVEKFMKQELRMADAAMYKFSLLTPTAAEKSLSKSDLEKWNRLQAFITQSEGSPSVAPSTDPRPEIGSTLDAFQEVA